jgi:hypothetical protein
MAVQIQCPILRVYQGYITSALKDDFLWTVQLAPARISDMWK